MTIRTYCGQRVKGGAIVYSAFGTSSNSIDPRYDLFNHSPDGFEWGYEGSGPAQLALALCADLLHDDARALRIYQDFKRRVVANIASDTWQLTAAELLDEIHALEKASL